MFVNCRHERLNAAKALGLRTDAPTDVPMEMHVTPTKKRVPEEEKRRETYLSIRAWGFNICVRRGAVLRGRVVSDSLDRTIQTPTAVFVNHLGVSGETWLLCGF